MSDIGLQPARALAEAIKRRDLSSRELLEHYLTRVEALNPAEDRRHAHPDGARRPVIFGKTMHFQTPRAMLRIVRRGARAAPTMSGGRKGRA